MENVNTSENVGQISLSKLWEVLKKYLLWVVLAAVVVGSVVAVFAQFFIKDKYQSRLDYLLGNLIELTGTELNYMSQFVDDAVVKLSSTPTIERVVETAGIFSSDSTGDNRAVISQMKSATDISSNAKGSGFSIIVTTNSPKVSFAMIQAYKDLMPDLEEDYGLKPFELIESPYTAPTVPSNRNRAVKYGLIGAVAGAVLIYAIFLVHDLFDVTIRTEQDLKKYLNVPVIGMIPQYSGEGVQGEKRGYKYRRYGYNSRYGRQ